MRDERGKTPAVDPSELWVDMIRNIAVVAVILVHVTAPITLEFGNVADWNWHVGNALDSLARPCVPLFFMISGYLLLNRSEPSLTFFKKRVSRIAVPLVFWSLFYLIFKNHAALSQLDWRDLTSLLTSPAEYHLWFLYALIAVYLFIPLLRQLVAATAPETLKMITFVWLGVASIGPALGWWTGRDHFANFDLLLGYTGYALAGHVLGRLELTRTYITIAAMIAVTSYVTITWGTWSASVKNSEFVPDVYNYIGPIVIIYSSAVFVLLRTVFETVSPRFSHTTVKAVKWCAALSFGIYLVHAAVLDLLFSSGISAFNVFGPSPLLTSLATTATTFTISMALVALILKVPGLNRIV